MTNFGDTRGCCCYTFWTGSVAFIVLSNWCAVASSWYSRIVGMSILTGFVTLSSGSTFSSWQHIVENPCLFHSLC
jgi:hypothetical protein